MSDLLRKMSGGNKTNTETNRTKKMMKPHTTICLFFLMDEKRKCCFPRVICLSFLSDQPGEEKTK